MRRREEEIASAPCEDPGLYPRDLPLQAGMDHRWDRRFEHSHVNSLGYPVTGSVIVLRQISGVAHSQPRLSHYLLAGTFSWAMV